MEDKARARLWDHLDQHEVLEELPNEKGNDTSRILFFGIPDDCFREDRSYCENCADPGCSETLTLH
jgi:hypothetical protein